MAKDCNKAGQGRVGAGLKSEVSSDLDGQGRLEVFCGDDIGVIASH